MILKTLRLHNFRNYEDETLSFNPNLNIIYGNNAEGKTNLLEAVSLISTGKSFRTAHLKELIMQGKNYFLLEAEIVKDLVAQTITIYFEENKKKVLHNLNSLPSLTSLLGILPSVVHAPSDIELISGQPTHRRRFLNLHIAQHDPVYVHHLLRFLKALKQRNHLLKTQDLSSIEIWEYEMAKSASYLSLKRGKLITQLNEPINEIIKNFSNNNEQILLRYTPGFSCMGDIKQTIDLYLKQLHKNRQKDLMLKTTTFGPHRDDFLSYINNKPAKIFASEGQKKSLVTAMRLAEYNLLCKRINSPAIMNIDDIDIHLDKTRIEKLHEEIKSLNQVFITMPYYNQDWESEDINLIKIQSGKKIN